MISITRILCPVDSSDFSFRALRYGSELAAWYRAELVALSVRPSFMPSTPLERWPALDPEAVQRRDASLRTFVRDAVGESNPRIIMVEGDVVEQIVSVASEIPADMIVMGTHGLRGFERLLLGSVTERVLRKAPCPVLTVPRQTTEAATHTVAFKTIVCAVDFSPASRRAVHYALSLAQESAGRLLLVHALDGRRTFAQRAQSELEALIPPSARLWCEPEVVVGDDRAYVEVLRVAAERQADLIVLGVHGRDAIDLRLFGSTAQHVTRSARCPVLTVGVNAMITTTG